MTRPPFPKSFPEFARQFNSEDACFQYIIQSRWPDGFQCGRCDSDKAYTRNGFKAIQCARCDKVYSATAGTVMHRSRQPLCSWLWAAYLVVTDKRGMSAVQLRRQLGINRYETAFNMLHKLRAAMVNPGRELLHGEIEVDETYIGGPKPGKRGRGASGKALVVGATEVKNGRPQRVRFKLIGSATQKELSAFVHTTIETGSTVITDGLTSYGSLGQEGYHHVVQLPTKGESEESVLPHLHIAFSNLKTWLLGTHHGAVSKKHLQAYLSEFAFRYNRRGNLQAAFQTLLGLTGKVEGPTYKGLYKGEFEHQNPDYHT